MADNLAVDNIRLQRAESRLAKSLAGFKLGDTVFHLLTLAAAWAVLILLGGVIASLVLGSMPAIKAFGLNFLSTEAWNPVTEKFGAMAPVYGTIVTLSLIHILCRGLAPIAVAPHNPFRDLNEAPQASIIKPPERKKTQELGFGSTICAS